MRLPASSRTALLGLVWAICGIVLAARPVAAATELVGHRAMYSLALETSRGEIVGASGVMGFEVIDACDGWAVRQRLAITVTGRDGTDIELQSDYTTWESKDGLRLRFRMKQITEGAVVTELAGTASLERAGGPGRVVYSLPLDTTQELPEGTLFPTAHTVAVLDAARAGQRFLALPLFDGTSADGVHDTTAVIAGWTKPAANAWPELATLASARVRIAFFQREGSNQQPEYEVGMRYWENGIADDLNLDFGDYVLSGKLTELEVPKPGC
jgi:hypothetical protein